MGHPACTDITLLFKTCVKTIRTRNRACGIPDPDRPKPEKRKNPLSQRAKEVVAQVAKMAAFVNDISAAYVNFNGHIPGAPQMTDSERDRIDVGIPRLGEQAKAMLGDLEAAVYERDLSAQHKEHQIAVIQLIKDYLRRVVDKHSEMRSKRVAFNGEAKKLARLDGRLRVEKPPEEKPEIPEWTTQEELSAEELQMFEEENNALLMELSGYMSELHTLEGTLTGVAKLQELFTEKVVEQEVQIEKVHATAVGTTENIKDANEQLRQAIQRNAGLRVYILFSLLVMSFSLLFLDWYND